MVKYNTDVGLIYLLMFFSFVISCPSFKFLYLLLHSIGMKHLLQQKNGLTVDWKENFRIGKGSRWQHCFSNILKPQVIVKNTFYMMT